MTRTVALVVAMLAGSATAVLLLGPPGPRLPRASRVSRRPRSPALVASAGLAVLTAAVATGLQGRHLALLAVVGGAGVGAFRGVERGRRERVAQRTRQEVIDYCEALAGELRAGQAINRAVERSVAVWPASEVVAAAARLDASVPRALRRLAALPGAAAVRRLAGAWEVSSSTGAGLVVAVEQVLATARAEEATARLVRAELASARATARLVSGLPVVVLLAAQGIGARPWHFLLDTPAGVGCLAAGVALSLAGLAWIDRIAAASSEGGG